MRSLLGEMCVFGKEYSTNTINKTGCEISSSVDIAGMQSRPIWLSKVAQIYPSVFCSDECVMILSSVLQAKRYNIKAPLPKGIRQESSSPVVP